jgi:alpha-pyrone synthase
MAQGKFMTVMTAIGTANPRYGQNQGDTVAFLAEALGLSRAERRLFKSVYAATGIERRYSVLGDFLLQKGEFSFFPNDEQSAFPSTAQRMNIYKQHALPLAKAAIADCLSQLKDFALDSITHLITVSCTGMYAPGIDIELVQQLGLRSTTKRTTVNFMGCYGAFNALKIADAVCRSDQRAVVMVVCVEICSIHFQENMSLDNIIANAIFSDGAAAVIIEPEAKSSKQLAIEKFHSDILPDTNQHMAWHIGDKGFDIVLSQYVSSLIESGIPVFLRDLFRSEKISVSDIDIFAIHPGGIKILEACEAALNIDKSHNQHAYDVLSQYGNMSSATILFVLKSIMSSLSKLDHDKRILSCAFGPGLTIESMLLRVENAH